MRLPPFHNVVYLPSYRNQESSDDGVHVETSSYSKG